MKKQTTYLVNSIKTLIDLNGDATNFHLVFNVKSTNNAPFEMVIVDQQTMNTQESLQYQSIDEGEINGELTWDRNIFQTFYMILKAKNPTEISVDLDLKLIEPASFDEAVPQMQMVKAKTSSPPKTEANYTLYLGILVACVVVGIIVYFNRDTEGSKMSSDIKPKIVPSSGESILAKLKQAPNGGIENKFNFKM